LFAQLEVIVDFAIEHEPIAVAVRHGLGAGIQVNDAQAAMSQADVSARVLPEPFPVRAAVMNEVVHDPQLPIEARSALAG